MVPMINLLIFVLIVLIVLGLILYAVATYAPIPQPLKNLACFVVIVIAALIILAGMLGGLGPIHFVASTAGLAPSLARG
jgi:hypothetical protein